MRSLPPAQRVGIVVAVVVLVMAAVPFMQWVMTPSYALLFAGLEDKHLSEVVNELETRGVPYQLDGSRVLVPQQQLHRVRADLAAAGVSGTPTVPGYELLDNQALGVSDFRQRVDLQRAVEGELTRTLTAMDGIESATVRLVIPEESLFTEQRKPGDGQRAPRQQPAARRQPGRGDHPAGLLGRRGPHPRPGHRRRHGRQRPARPR